MSSKAFGSMQPRRPHLVQGDGLGGEVADLRADVEVAFVVLESTDVDKGASCIGVQDAAGKFTSSPKTVEAVLLELANAVAGDSSRIHAAVANTAAIQAIAAADRINGMVVVDLANMYLWKFMAGAAGTADAWTLIPSVGTGRWVRTELGRSEVASTAHGLGAALQGVEDAAGRIVAQDTESALEELAARVMVTYPNVNAITYITELARVDGSIAVASDTGYAWVFIAASTEADSDWVKVPQVGTGRWVRRVLSKSELAAVTAAALIGSDASGYIAATVAAQLTEVKAIADANMGVAKKTVTIDQLADLSTLPALQQTFTKNIVGVLPANARFLSASCGESAFVAFDDAAHTTPITVSLETATAKEIRTGIDASATGAEDFPNDVGKRADYGYTMAPLGGEQLTVTVTAAVDLNTLTDGHIDVNVFYIVIP